MNLLFSFLEPEHPHCTLLAGYFSKVVACLLLRKSAPLINYIQAHPDIIQKLVDLVGITSIMEVLIRLIGADENLYTSFADSTKWLEDIDVLKMIVDKFSSSDSPQVHANAAETLCAISRYASPGLAAKISSPSFIARLFHHALGESRPKSVLVNALCVCICLLDPNRQTSATSYFYNRQLIHNSSVTTNPEIVEGMLESLGNLSKLLEVSTDENVLLTTYGKLQPPLGKHRLKIVEFISVLMSVRSEAAENELVRLGVLRRILELFFQYPYNNFIHHHAEQIIVCCLESKNASLVEHILEDCNLVRNIIDAEKNSASDTDKKIDSPTVLAEGRVPPRIGNVGHMTRIANKLIQLGTDNTYIQAHLQNNSEWVEWHANVLEGRNALENVLQWACGRPTPLHDPSRDSDDDDYHDKDYDVATLTNNLSQAFGYGFYENADSNEVLKMNKGKEIMPTYVSQEGSSVLTSNEKSKKMERGEMSEMPHNVLHHEYHHKGANGNCPKAPQNSIHPRRMSFVDFERDKRDLMRKKRLVGEHIEDLKREIKRLKRPSSKRDKEEKPRGQFALKATSYKVTKHEKACMENQHVFIAFTFDTFGFLVQDVVELLSRLHPTNRSCIAHGSMEGDDEDVYFDDESAEVVISSLQLGDDQERGSLFTNSNWFTADEEKVDSKPSTNAASPPPTTEAAPGGNDGGFTPENNDDLSDTATSSTNDSRPSETDKPPEQVDRKDSGEPGGTTTTTATDPSGTSPLSSEPEPLKVETSDRGDEREASSSTAADEMVAEGGGPPRSETHTDGEEKK
ncbi:unnamed protein product [Lactuca saligna]|uniref:Uncharacterized protein n=1 Tax=Lactuca saligna TaxID=75948 RepID=A0AA35Y8M6_LACSI|nr:unnamed protein product [Lactuca saligna]